MAKQPVITEKEVSLANRLIIAGTAVAIIASLLLLRHCHKVDSQIIVLPAVSGKFEAVKPVHTPVVAGTFGKKQSGAKKEDASDDEKLSKLLAENERLKSDFTKANDSLKAVIYAQAIQLNNFTQTFDDEHMTATASGIVRGEIQSLKLDYTIKERKIEAPKAKETVFRLLGGAELGQSMSLDKLSLKGNLMIQDKHGNIISASYDTRQVIWVGYNASIFDIKR